MPKRRYSSRRTRGYVPLDPDRLGPLPRVERGADGSESTVRRVRGSAKSYRCPGCDQLISPGTSHVVAWANTHLLGADAALADRRHWHVSCWEARHRRRPDRRR